ncbi:thioredoxin family protein [Roseateles sp.]|uniref:thioredoxin family protein n=1 Tax=Roseateles sp. TaxID=1971397 RepID=UPI003266F6B0
MRSERRRRAAVNGWPHRLLAASLCLLCMAGAQAAVDELRPYPRAELMGRYDNPLEAGALPISPPQRSATNSNRTSRWRLPYEGTVAMVQYKHKADDSPLLIARHYAGQLKEQGFELVTICEIPCAAPDGAADASVYWFHELDLAKKLGYNFFGDRGMYLIGHRADAIVAIRVGTAYQGYASTIKTVSAPGLDRGPLLAYVAAQRAPVADAPLPAPPGRVAAPPPAPASAATGAPFVKDIAPGELSAWLRKTKGWVVVQLSSYDPNCTYCIPANPPFNALAQAEAAKGGITFVRVAFQPWTSMSNNDFVTQYGVGGLPTVFTFQDGQLMRRQMGKADEATLRKALLDGLR